MSLKQSRIPTLGGRQFLSGLVDGAAALGAAAASRTKGALSPNNGKQGKAKKQKGNVKVETAFKTAKMSSSLIAAPLNVGTVTNSTNAGHRHTPFHVSGSCVMGSLSSNASGALILSNQALGVTSTLKFSLDIAGSGSTAGNFAAFPNVVRNVALSFVRYRVLRFKITYVSTCPTTTPGTIAIGASPEVVATNDSANYGTDIVAFSRNMSCPVWSTNTFNPHGHDGIDGSWYYVDPTGYTDESNLRQECPGSLFFGVLGTLPVSTSLGYLKAEYEFELEALQNTSLFNAFRIDERKDQRECAAIAQPSVVVPQPGQAAPPPTPEHTFVYVSGNQRYTPQL